MDPLLTPLILAASLHMTKIEGPELEYNWKTQQLQAANGSREGSKLNAWTRFDTFCRGQGGINTCDDSGSDSN
jgi:hypothetical protein